jgi:hypothetical protein
MAAAAAAVAGRTTPTVAMRSFHIVARKIQDEHWHEPPVASPRPLCPQRGNEDVSRRLYAASAASFAKNSNRGGGAMKKRKKVNKKKKLAQSRQIDTLWSNIFEDEPARMTPSKKGNSNNRGMVVRRNDANTNDPELVALLNSLNISMSSDDDDDDVDLSDLISFGDDTDDDDDSDGDDDSDEDSAGQFYQQAVQTLQSDKAVRANLGGKVRVGPIMSQNSTTEYGTGRSAQTSHQYTFSVSGSKGRASARLHVNADRTSWVDLELFRGQTLTIPLENHSTKNNNNGSNNGSNNADDDDDDDETTAEVLSTNSFGRRFKRSAHHWDDPSDIVEAEIVEKEYENTTTTTTTTTTDYPSSHQQKQKERP